MRVQVSPRLAAACALVASLGLVALAGPSAAAATAGPAAATSGQPPANRANVGATHSPQLLRQLAGPAGTARAAASAITRSAITGAVQGVDVASFQHPSKALIDWQQVAGDGIQFAAVKATEGDYYRNPYALTDLAGAQAAGLSVIPYAFAIPNGNGSSKSPAVQADYLLSYLGASSGVPVLLDIEYDPYTSTDHTDDCYGLTQSAMRAWIAGFDSEVHAKTGRLPIIYTTQDWWAQVHRRTARRPGRPRSGRPTTPPRTARWYRPDGRTGISGSTPAPAPWTGSRPPGTPTSTRSTRASSPCSTPAPGRGSRAARSISR